MPSNLSEFFLGATAASGACFFTNPLEVVKIRMQLQGELQARGSYSIHYRNVFHASYTIAKHEGLTALQKGLRPALLYQAIMNGTRLGSYQVFTNFGLTSASDGKPVLLKCVVAGALAGALGAFLASPAYMVKTQLQSQSAQQIAVGHQHAHKGFISPLKETYSKFGIIGVWRGAGGAVANVMVGSASQLSSFSTAKSYIQGAKIFPEESWLVSACASMVSSIAIVTCVTPFDVICTRLYNQATNSTGKGITYSGYLDCCLSILKKEGLLGFYKGFWPHYFRMGPHTILSLLFWDELRKAYKHYI